MAVAPKRNIFIAFNGNTQLSFFKYIPVRQPGRIMQHAVPNQVMRHECPFEKLWSLHSRGYAYSIIDSLHRKSLLSIPSISSSCFSPGISKCVPPSLSGLFLFPVIRYDQTVIPTLPRRDSSLIIRHSIESIFHRFYYGDDITVHGFRVLQTDFKCSDKFRKALTGIRNRYSSLFTC